MQIKYLSSHTDVIFVCLLPDFRTELFSSVLPDIFPFPYLSTASICYVVFLMELILKCKYYLIYFLFKHPVCVCILIFDCNKRRWLIQPVPGSSEDLIFGSGEVLIPRETSISRKAEPSRLEIPGLLLPNLHHCAAVIRRTSDCCAIGKPFFKKTDDGPSLKFRKVFKLCLLLSTRHSCISPCIYHKNINICYFKHASTTLYFYGFSSNQVSFAQITYTW